MKNQLVRKSNHMIEASYRLSATEQKIIAFLAAAVKTTDEDFKPYTFKIQDFLAFLGESEKNYEWLRDLLVNLKSKNLVIIYPSDTGAEVRVDTSWVFSILQESGSGNVELCFDAKLKPFLLNLKSRFTKYQLKNVIYLKSQYAIRIYELLKQYETPGTRIFEYADLREILGINTDQYDRFTDFRKWVLTTAQVELEKKTDIFFTFEEIRTERAVSKIKFSIFPRQALQAKRDVLSQISEGEELERLVSLLPACHQGSAVFRKLLTVNLGRGGFDFVARNIKYASSRSNAAIPGADPKKRGNYRNYLNKALSGDFGLAAQEDAEVAAKMAEAAAQKAREVEEAARISAEALCADQVRCEKARDLIAALSVEEQQKLRTRAIESLPSKVQELVARNAPGTKTLVQMAMERLVTS
ncbi:MAG: replication initiation protein [Terrimicrobiaceae bacterium]